MDKKIIIERMFDAPREAVWNAWTDPEWVKKWWGPKDFTAPEIKIDLVVGGKYLFCMHGKSAPEMPEQDFWSTGTYREIVPFERLVLTDAFSDAQGTIIDPTVYGMDPNFPKESEVTVLFEDQDGKTKLSIIYIPETEAAYNAMEKSGMREGWGQSLDKLAESLL